MKLKAFVLISLLAGSCYALKEPPHPRADGFSYTSDDEGGNGFKDMLRQVLRILRDMRDTMKKIEAHEESMDRNIQRMADKITK